MDIHKNARLSFRSRPQSKESSQICDRAGGHAEGGCSPFRVSAKTAAKWTKAVPPRRSRWFEGSQFATATQSTSFARTT